jgi:hypothetical protein
MKRLFSVVFIALAMLALVAAPVVFASHSGDRDCEDFDTQAQAQRFFDRHGGSPSNNVDRLDANGDGIPCENLPGGGDGGGNGGGGGGGGGGGTDMPDSSTLSAPVSLGSEMPWLLVLTASATAGFVFHRRLVASR